MGALVLASGLPAVEHPEARARLARFDRPVLFYSFTDDDYAPRRAVAQLAAVRERELDSPPARAPRRRRGRVGHFGFFRRGSPRLWQEALEFLDAVIEGKKPTGRTGTKARTTWTSSGVSTPPTCLPI